MLVTIDNRIEQLFVLQAHSVCGIKVRTLEQGSEEQLNNDNATHAVDVRYMGDPKDTQQVYTVYFAYVYDAEAYVKSLKLHVNAAMGTA